MDTTVASYVRRGDLPALTRALHELGGMAPEALGARTREWATIAVRGEDAARRGDLNGARGSCRDCHHLFRDDYRLRFRDRPLPPSAGQQSRP
jgi:hypothetical protein